MSDRFFGGNSAMKAALSVSVVSLGLVIGAAVRAPESARVLDRLAAPYLEDNGSGRVLAHIEAVLRRSDAGAHLEIAIDRQHPSLTPVPGFAGFPGANRLPTPAADQPAP